MRKRIVLALMLVVALVAATGCSLIVKDPEVDKATVIIEVMGESITKGTVQEYTQMVQESDAYYYSVYYGAEYDPNDPENIAAAQEAAVYALIEETVMAKKYAQTGVDVFTAEEQAQLEASADATYQEYYDSILTYYFADSELTGDELTAAVEAEMAAMGYPTREELLDYEKSAKAQEKLKAQVVADVTVSEDEITNEYLLRVSEDEINYQYDPAAFENVLQNGGVYYCAPEGFRYVKHILRVFTDEDNAVLSDLDSRIADTQSKLAAAESELAAMGDAAGDDDAAASNRAALNDTIAAAKAELADLEAQRDAAYAAACANIQPTVDEILARVQAGEDFDALMAEYGEDPGMQAAPTMEVGYPVSSASTRWVTEFRDGAMALANVGDVSGAVFTDFGIHIIKYVSDIPVGEVGIDAVHDLIRDELLIEKQDAAYADAVQAWVDEAGAKVYMDRMN